MTEVMPETSSEYDRTRMIERPNGFFWQARGGGREYGPFSTLLEAVQDMQVRDDAEGEPSPVPLKEAETKLGIADFIDPESGEPMEEGHPRLEDH